MTVKIVPRPSIAENLSFDVILPGGYVKEYTLTVYELRQYRGASISDIIEQKVLDLLQDLGQTVDTVAIIYC